jgi:hypothetical protein
MNQEQFLHECSKTYPEAMAALGYFRQLIQEQCKTVVEKRLGEFAKAIGIAQDLKLVEYAAPDRPVPNALNATDLGWQARPSDELYLYFYLRWTRPPDDDSARMSVVIAIWLKDRGKRELLARDMNRHSEDIALKDEHCRQANRHFSADLQEDETPQVGERLNTLLDYTIKFLKSLPDIEGHFQA